MSDEELRVLASTTLLHLFTSEKATAPISSMDLLVKVIACRAIPGLPNPEASAPRLRLTDLKRFESTLESFSQGWEHGVMRLSREGPEARMSVLEVRMNGGADSWACGTDTGGLRKRKRVIDEDADSAAGNEDDDEYTEEYKRDAASSTPLGGLNKELREVYAILQRGTAKGRLLAEQVSSSSFCTHAPRLIQHISSDCRQIPLNPFALKSPKKSASSSSASPPPTPTRARAPLSTSDLSSARTPILHWATAPT